MRHFLLMALVLPSTSVVAMTGFQHVAMQEAHTSRLRCWSWPMSLNTTRAKRYYLCSSSSSAADGGSGLRQLSSYEQSKPSSSKVNQFSGRHFCAVLLRPVVEIENLAYTAHSNDEVEVQLGIKPLRAVHLTQRHDAILRKCDLLKVIWRERALRGFALGRKSWLFAGSERGADRAAAVTTLIMTAKLNDIDPLAWLADVLARIAEIPQSRLHELLP